MNSRSFQNGACDIPAHLSASSASFVSGILNSDLARQVLSVPTTSSNSSSSTKDESTQHERTETSSLQQQHAVSSPQPPPVYTLPPDLPAPADDYACDHLRSGRFFVPSLCLEATSGKKVDFSQLKGTSVVFLHPSVHEIGGESTPLPSDWASIPGAEGCAAQCCAFRESASDLRAAGADHIFGLSLQPLVIQKDVVHALKLPFALVSDEQQLLTKKMLLPCFSVGNRRFLKRATLIISWGKVEHVFYPVFPPDQHAAVVLEWLRARAACEDRVSHENDVDVLSAFSAELGASSHFLEQVAHQRDRAEFSADVKRLLQEAGVLPTAVPVPSSSSTAALVCESQESRTSRSDERSSDPLRCALNAVTDSSSDDSLLLVQAKLAALHQGLL